MVRPFFLTLSVLAFTTTASAQIAINGSDVSVGGAYGYGSNVKIVNGVVSVDGPNGPITAGNGSASVNGPNGPITVNPNNNQSQSTIRQNGRQNRYQRQGDLTINDNQNGQSAIATGNNQTVTNSAGNIAENRSGQQGRQSQPAAVSAPGAAPNNGDAFWGKGGFWGDRN